MTSPPAVPPSPVPGSFAVVSAPARRPVRVWDVVVTSILLVLDLGLTLLMSFFGLFLAMAGDSCGVRDCDTELIAIGMMVAVALPWVFLAITAIVSIVLLVLRRLTFWVPLVGGVLIVGALIIGGGLATAGVPPA